MSTYTIRSYPDGEAGDEDARAAAKAVWRISLGPESVLDARYDALCLHSPYGKPILRFVVHEPSADVVGVAAIAPRRMLRDGREIRAGVLAHFAVSPGHRSLGPALTLLTSLLAQAREECEVVLGIPRNSPGAGAVLKRAGLRPFADLVRRVKLLRHGHYLQRRLPARLAHVVGGGLDAVSGLPVRWRRMIGGALEAHWSSSVDPDTDTLWKRAQPQRVLTSVRDARMLAWRFDPATAGDVRYLCIRDTGGGPLLAWFACSIDPQWPHLLNVEDFWARDAEQAMPLPFIDALSRQARRDGHAAISLAFAGAAGCDATWIRAGFVERDRQPIFGAFRGDTGDVHLTNLDRDG